MNTLWLIVLQKQNQALPQYVPLCTPGIIPLSRSKESQCVSTFLHTFLCFIFYSNRQQSAFYNCWVTDIIEQVQVSRVSELIAF